MRRGGRLWKGGRRDSRLLLNISVVMERDRITGRPLAAPSPNSELRLCYGKKHPGVTFIHFCGHISLPFGCSEVVGRSVPRAELCEVGLLLKPCFPSPRCSRSFPSGPPLHLEVPRVPRRLAPSSGKGWGDRQRRWGLGWRHLGCWLVGLSTVWFACLLPAKSVCKAASVCSLK